MAGAFEFLRALTIVLGVAAAVTIVFQRVHQPVVLGYIIAGLMIGPHVAVPLVADREIVQILSELGVILLMFSLGLEFSIRKLIQVGPKAGITAVVQTSLMILLGFTAAKAFGWTTVECLFTGAIIAISSTTIIAKAFDEQRIRGPFREFVVGVLIVEDLVAVFLMATLTAIASGSGLSARALVITTGRLAAFLAGLVVLGLLLVPRAFRAIVRLGRSETTLISAVAVCFGTSLLAHSLGYSVALGAFLAGSLVAESGEEKRIEHLITPVRDMFAAVFFVSVGLMIDPWQIAHHWDAVLVITAVVIAGKILGVTLGAFLTGNGVRPAVRSGMSLAQIGEFSFIIAGLGLDLRATRDFLYPVAVSVSALTTLSTPWLIRSSDAFAGFVDRHLPPSLQIFAALYGTWIERLRKPLHKRTRGAAVRRLVKYLLLDALIVTGIAVSTAVYSAKIVETLHARLSLNPAASQWLVVLAAVALSLPFAVGLARVGHRLALLLADAAFPRATAGRVDLAVAPRRMLIAAVQLTIVLLVGTPFVVIALPFLPAGQVAVALGLVLVAFAIGLWRSARNLRGHVRAGVQVITDALKAQSHAQGGTAGQPIALAHELLPGLGALVPVAITQSSSATGKTLTELNLPGLTGATVIAIHRVQGDLLMPGASERLRVADIVVLVGSEPAVQAATQLLRGARSPT